MRGLANQIALVTGATGLIGGAICQRLAQEQVTVLVGSRQLEKATHWISQQSPDLLPYLHPLALDLQQPETFVDTIATLKAANQYPSIVIANASRREKLGTPFNDIQAEHFLGLFETDAAGHFLLAREWANGLASEQQAASLIFLSSIYAVVGVDHAIYPQGMLPTPVQYATVKASLEGLTRYLASLWGTRSIRVNSVVAGGVRAENRQLDDFVLAYNAKTALGRMAQAHEVAAAVSFLASSDASYITGQSLVVDGGFTTK